MVAECVSLTGTFFSFNVHVWWVCSRMVVAAGGRNTPVGSLRFNGLNCLRVWGTNLFAGRGDSPGIRLQPVGC